YTSFNDVSPSFTIKKLVVSSPTNGTEVWLAGKTYNITWSQELVTGTIDIEYAEDGSTFTPLFSGVSAALGSQAWAIPADQMPTTLGKIRIKDNSASATVYDVSDASFTISKLKLLTPNGGEKLQTGNSYALTWESSNIANVGLYYTTDNGSTWTLIANNLPSTPATYTWSPIPDAAISDQARIRISDASDGSFFRSDVSDNIFVVKKLAVTAPLAGANLRANGTATISWSKSSNVSSVKIQYAQNGTTFSDIAGAVGLTGTSYTWTVPSTVTTTGKIRIIDEVTSEILAVSGAFNITTLALTYPVGGEKLQAGRTVNITWSGLTPVRIDYSKDGGTTWTNIITSATGNSYAWSIPAISGSFPAGTNYKIKIGDPVNFATFNDISASFTIKNLIVTSPTNGTEIWLTGKTYNITWDQSLVTGNVDIDYASDGSSYSYNIVSGYDGTLGTYAWSIPAGLTATTTGKIRIKDNDAPTTVFDESNYAFTIAKLNLTSPNSGLERLQTGKNFPITWTSENIANVRIDYSTDNGATWTLIVYNLNAALLTYNWTGIPAAAVTSQGRIRISDASDGPTYTRSDLSDNPFSVKLLNITTPVAGANLKAGASYNITWSKSSNVSSVKIHYAQDGVAFSQIGGALGLTGTTYSWTVPAAATSTGKIRIIDETDNSILAESGAFNITELALTYPLGGEKLQAGTTKNITWTGLSPAKIEYSTNGTTWNLITSGATGGS
ncbi:MAG TPA: hypothetical protein VHP30_16145, partial [Ignavibacteriales bacterium]|nr:hypothetical protein [Ignavibacteriales bacterium]